MTSANMNSDNTIRNIRNSVKAAQAPGGALEGLKLDVEVLGFRRLLVNVSPVETTTATWIALYERVNDWTRANFPDSFSYKVRVALTRG